MICYSFIEMLSFIVPIRKKDNTVEPFCYILAEFIYSPAAVERYDLTHHAYFPKGGNIPFPFNNNRNSFVDFVKGLKNNPESFSPLKVIGLVVHWQSIMVGLNSLLAGMIRDRLSNRICRQTRWESDTLCGQGVAAAHLRNHRTLTVSCTSVRPHMFQK